MRARLSVTVQEVMVTSLALALASILLENDSIERRVFLKASVQRVARPEPPVGGGTWNIANHEGRLAPGTV